MKLWKLIYSNKFFAITTLLIQLGLIGLFVFYFKSNSGIFFLASYLASAILIIFEVNRHEESGFKVTWIMLIAVIPVFGWFFYIYTHTDMISKNIMRSQLSTREQLRAIREDDSDVLREMTENHHPSSLARYLSGAADYSVYKNTMFTYYNIGEDMFRDMLDEIRTAEKFIFIEFFIINKKSYMWNLLEDLLKEKAAQGVDVRLIYDGMGCLRIMPKGYEEKLKRMGIKTQIFAPIQPLLSTYQNNRDHRKIVVVDGRCAFSGGINISDEYINRQRRFGHWKDTGFKLCGEGVRGFTELFLTMWGTTASNEEIDFSYFLGESKKHSYPNAEGYVVPFGCSPYEEHHVGRNAYIDMLNNAKEYVYIMTPYLAIDDGIYDAMYYAVKRGVNVKIIMPGIPDKKMPYCLAKSYYRDLFDIGVEIYEYTPGFVHAKTTVSDEKRAIVGTINYDYRSLYLHYECAAYIVDSPQIKEIREDMINTLTACRRITQTEYEQYPWIYRAMGRIYRLVATMI